MGDRVPIQRRERLIPSASWRRASSFFFIASLEALEGNVADSRDEYETFFALWKDAEPDVPVLRQAKSEYAKPGERPQSGRP